VLHVVSQHKPSGYRVRQIAAATGPSLASRYAVDDGMVFLSEWDTGFGTPSAPPTRGNLPQVLNRLDELYSLVNNRARRMKLRTVSYRQCAFAVDDKH
jgi:hypothetical protein